jgi:uncharacterized protein (DUF362 family)/Pyruvate/2-oxoacid:ferredoxin oxidoreductase delta subunit
MSVVVFKKASYDYEILKPVIFEVLSCLDDHLFDKNTRVLIKPNLLLPTAPENGITTHPFVVKAVAEYVKEKGAHVVISDSPAVGSFRKIMIQGGYYDVFKDMNIEFKAFDGTKKKDIGEPFGEIDIAKEALEADVVINLAKLKTHSQMLLTLGVKNIFGCIVGFKKADWHFKAGVDRQMFARLLVQIYNAVAPSITIVDGILAMEGQGPGKRGIPRFLNVIVGSINAISADMAICSLLGLDQDKLLTNKAAKQLGLASDNIYIKGDFNIVNDFVFPEIGDVVFGPKYLHNIMRKHLIQKPVVDNGLCKLCGECWKYCPAQSISWDVKKIYFDYNTCIRCYCCLEICSHGAIHSKVPLAGKIFRRLLNIR